MEKSVNRPIYEPPVITLCDIVVEKGFGESFIPEEGEWDN